MTTPAPPAPPATAPGSATGNNQSLTAEQVQKVLVQPLQDASVFLAAGPTPYVTNGSPVRVPRLVGMSQDPEWVGENEEIPDGARLETDEVNLLPEHMKSIKVISRFSNELARQSIVDISTTVKDRLVLDVANMLDQALLTSAVTDGSVPLGLLNYPGTQTMNGVGTLSLDDLQDALGDMLGADVDPTKLRWFMRSDIFTHVRKLKDGNDRYQVQPDPTQVGAFQLLSIPVTVTNRIPGGSSTTVVLADFSKIAVAVDQAPSVTLLPERYAEFDQIGIRVTTRYDAKPLLPEAIMLMRGVTV